MSLTRDDVRNMARLSRIAASEDDLELWARELAHIIDWIDQLREVDTEGIEPMTSATNIRLHMRADRVADGDIQDQILANAPKSDSGFFIVPKAIE